MTLVKGLEQILATEASKDTSYNFASLYMFRKGLIIPDIPEAKTKNTYLDEHIDRNRTTR